MYAYSKKSFKTVITIIFSLIFIACDHDDDNNSNILDEGWKESEYFFHTNKVLLNSISTENELIISGYLAHFSIYDSTHYPHGFDWWSALSISSKPALSKNILAVIHGDRDRIHFRYAKYPVYDHSNLIVTLQALDPNYSNSAFIDLNGLHRTLGVFNNYNHFITNVYDTSGVSLLLIKYDYVDNPISPSFNIVSTKRFFLWSKMYHFIYDIQSVDDKFLVCSSDGLFLIDTVGAYTKVLNNTIYRLGYCGNNIYGHSDNYLYLSLDKGQNWQLLYSNFPYVDFKFSEVQNKLILYYHHQIYYLNVDSNYLQEISSKNIESNEITSISEFKGYVYITTLGGLFYKPIDEFFKYENEALKKRINLE